MSKNHMITKDPDRGYLETNHSVLKAGKKNKNQTSTTTPNTIAPRTFYRDSDLG